MMDERVRDGFLRIRSELLAVVMGICAVSLVVKLVFLQGSLGDCITEYLVLVGSPVYLTVRSHMLGVTQAADMSKKNRLPMVMLAGFVFLMVFYRIQKNQGAWTGGMEAVLRVISFAISFVGGWYLYQNHERKRQKKLDSWYDKE